MEQTKQSDKARLGAMGEMMVVVKLMEHGWDAFNANCTIKNYKSVDVVCLNSGLKESTELWWKPQTALIQVKTCLQKNIPAGFSIDQCLDRSLLEKMVKGPYVFVYVVKKENDYTFRYFIISRKEIIDLLYAGHNWYRNMWYREKDIVGYSPACLSVKWLSGMNEPENAKHEAFINPLNGISCEDCWENIWKN